MIRDDPMRESLAGTVHEIATRFLVLHEQMHTIRGHLHYLFGANSPGYLQEIPSHGPILIPPHERCALELDADGGALATLIEAFESRNQMLGSFAPMVSSYWDWIRLVGVSALTVMLILSIGDEATNIPSERNHPSTQARMLNLINLLRFFMSRIPGYDEDSVHPSAYWLFRDIATVSEILQVPPPLLEAFVEWQRVKADQYSQAICKELAIHLQTFREIVPKLPW
jgi:hypothetical protein